MARGFVSRCALVGAVAAALVAGAWVNLAGAAAEPSYSDSDCEVIGDITVEGSDAGYYGKVARNAAKAYSDAAADVEDEDLQKSMRTLSKVWRKAGRGNVVAAAKAIGKAGKSYQNALEVYTSALIVCSQQGLTTSEEDSTSSTDPDRD